MLPLWSVVQAVPRHAPAICETLIAACLERWRSAKDSHSEVRRTALEALAAFSLQQLLEGYWATQKQVFIPLIVARLYHAPRLVRTSPKPHHQRLVLYPTAGEAVTWEKPQEEVQRFVQLIQSAAKPGASA